MPRAMGGSRADHRHDHHHRRRNDDGDKSSRARAALSTCTPCPPCSHACALDFRVHAGQGQDQERGRILPHPPSRGRLITWAVDQPDGAMGGGWGLGPGVYYTGRGLAFCTCNMSDGKGVKWSSREASTTPVLTVLIHMQW